MKLKTFFALPAEAMLGIAILEGAVVFYANQGAERRFHAVKRPAAVPVVLTEEIKPVTNRNTIEGIGTGVAKESVDITANAREKVVGIFFKDGEYVEDGKLPVQLNDDPYQTELEDAKIHLAEQERELRRLSRYNRVCAISISGNVEPGYTLGDVLMYLDLTLFIVSLGYLLLARREKTPHALMKFMQRLDRENPAKE